MDENPYEAPRTFEGASNAQSPISKVRPLIVLVVVAPLILVSEIGLFVALYWGRRMVSFEPARFRSWAPIVHSDAVLFLLVPMLAAFALGIILARSLPFRTAAAYTVGIAAGSILSFGALLVAMTIAINTWGM